MAHPTHPGMTLDQLQERLCELSVLVRNAVEEQHQICEELMGRAEQAATLADQSKVDWNVVDEAFADAVCDAEGQRPSEKTLARHFKKCGLLVVHEVEPVAITRNPL